MTGRQNRGRGVRNYIDFLVIDHDCIMDLNFAKKGTWNQCFSRSIRKKGHKDTIASKGDIVALCYISALSHKFFI